jgi:molybdate transport system ATP-binding protein
LPEEQITRQSDKFEYAVKMNKVKVAFCGNQILNDISWTVRKGERWALTGPNGAGKTTLLSLITADNPQGYSNDLVLFDRKRGSGETIWDIKKRIGFVSPELHLYFLRGNGIFNTVPGLDRPVDVRGNTISCADVIASGFHDLIGGTDRGSRVKLKIVQEWMSAMNLNHLLYSLFTEASLGEQRLLLLARALVKFPSLLILDEPCQGLDPFQAKLFIEMLEGLCTRLDTTMIYVTHYPDEIPNCVTKHLKLEAGRTIYCGTFNR